MFTQFDDDGQEFVVAYVSRSNNKIEAKYSSYEGECLVVVWVISTFRSYLYITNTTITRRLYHRLYQHSRFHHHLHHH